MEVWEVFQQKGHSDPFVHVGSVLAPDSELAITFAKECFFRRMEGTGLWVTRREDIHPMRDQGLLEQVTDKSYRYPEAYRGVVQKRAAARAKAEQLTGAPPAPRGRASKTAGDEY